jgi:hypothetical protein
MKKIVSLVAVVALVVCLGCETPVRRTSDEIQAQRQETILKEGVAQVGMPAIKNFREMKILKDVYELRDQTGLVTYTYMENMVPTVVPGHTALGGKLTYVGESIGYGIPAATQFTNPQKVEFTQLRNSGWIHNVIPQADPNGLFSPASAEGTWIMMLDKKSGKALPQYFEPRIVVSTFKYEFDAAPGKAEAEK